MTTPHNPNLSETPRTDALFASFLTANKGTGNTDFECYDLLKEHSETLERELTKLHKQNEELHQSFALVQQNEGKLLEDKQRLVQERDELRQQLDETQNLFNTAKLANQSLAQLALFEKYYCKRCFPDGPKEGGFSPCPEHGGCELGYELLSNLDAIRERDRAIRAEKQLSTLSLATMKLRQAAEALSKPEFTAVEYQDALFATKEALQTCKELGLE